uniref:LRRNT domain-containing protein n=1 Tax=Sinocyclocheilus grahami TaxID=75366 RepID=A0A672K3L1_SINGR
MLWLLSMVLALIAVVDACPIPCKCEDHDIIICSDQRLLELPHLPQSTKQLYATHNMIQALPDEGLEGLSILDLTKNVFKLSLNTNWQNISNLTKLFLSGNRLSTLTPRPFQGLLNLKILDLSDNYIETLPQKFLYGLIKLQILNLNMNKILSLSYGVLDGAPVLKDLQLRNNMIEMVEVGV